MSCLVKAIAAGLCLFAITAGAAGPGDSAQALAQQMREAMNSAGFEARMNVLVTRADGSHPEPFKLAMVGQSSAERQRLQLRGISPAAVHNHYFLAQRNGDGSVSALQSQAGDNGQYLKFDPYAGIYGSGIVLWDILGSWWLWPEQVLHGTGKIGKRVCSWITSIAKDKDNPVAEVESCVDREARLALRTRMYDGNHVLLRTTTVQHMVSRSDGAGMMAKVLEIVDASRTSTAVEVYAGDEEYQVGTQTFAPLDRLQNQGQRENQ